MRTLAVISLLAALCALPARAADLQKQLEGMAKKHKGTLAFYAKELKTGRTVAVNADVPVKTASVIKLAIFLEAFRQLDAGKRKLTDVVAVDDVNRSDGSGVLGFMHTGLQVTLEDLLNLMMIISDNTATNLLIDVLGVDAVNANAQRLGLTQTHLYKKIGVPAAWPMPADQKQFGLGKTTAREAAVLIEQVEKCELKDPDLCRRMLKVMVNQAFRNMVPRLIETFDATERLSSIANKTGGLDKARNDVALVYTQAGPVIISAFTNDNADQRWSCENEAELLIARMAKAVVDAWSPKGLLPSGPPRLAPAPADAGTR